VRSRAVSGYSAAAVEAALTAPSGEYGRRFELLDPSGSLITPLSVAADPDQPQAGEIFAATVDFDPDRTVRGGLDIGMIPPAETDLANRLRGGPFGYRVAAYFSWRMPDGGFAEVPMGRYLWQTPKRSVHTSGEGAWAVQMGDLTHLPDVDGPDAFPDHFQVSAGTLHTDAIKDVWRRMRFNNLDGVAASSARFGSTHSWTAQTGGEQLVFKSERHSELERRRLNLRSAADLWTYTVLRSQYPPTWRWERLASSTQKWAGVLTYLHDAIGYQPYHVDADGNPVARPSVDYSTVEPEFVFGSGDLSITEAPFDLVADPRTAANTVIGILDDTEHPTIAPSVTVRLHELFPDHPLIESRIRFRIKRTLTRTDAPTLDELRKACLREMFDSVAFYQSATLRILAWPFFEAFDPVGVRMDGDPELGGAGQLFQQRGWALNMFLGRMTVDVRRLWRGL